MRLGFRHTAFQAVCTVLVLCFALGLLERADTVQPVFGEDSVRVPILMYHSILRDSARQGKYVISPAVLAADLDALQEKGYTAVTVSDLLAYVQDGADLPEKPVMITFDDGYRSVYDNAFPILKKYRIPFVDALVGSWLKPASGTIMYGDQPVDRLGQSLGQHTVLGMDTLLGNPAMGDPDILLWIVVVHAVAILVADKCIGMRKQ